MEEKPALKVKTRLLLKIFLENNSYEKTSE